MDKTIGILGGMGPMATVDLFKMIVSMTDAESDQENIRIYIDNNTTIPDRTSYILGEGADPRSKLIESAKKLESMGSSCIIMPCNTAHYFYNDISEAVDIKCLNMIEETIRYIKSNHSDIDKVGLLGTAGTCKAGIYSNMAKEYGLDIEMPEKEHQETITKLIYDIKAGKYDFDKSKYDSCIDSLSIKGCKLFILGCTELSVADKVFQLEGKYIDPLYVLSKTAIEFVGKNVK